MATEKISTKPKSGRGGARPNSGRKKGQPNRKTAETIALAAKGMTPLEYLLELMRDKAQDEKMRLAAATAAAPYVHAKLSSMHVDHTSTDGTMTPKAAIDVSKLSSAAMAEILAAQKNAPR